MVLILFSLIFFFRIYLLDILAIFFSTNDYGNSIKFGHILGYFEQLNILNFFFGNGLATYYFSTNFSGILAHTEITLLDYVRYFGFFQGFLVYFFLIFPFRKSFLKIKSNLPAFFTFLIVLFYSLTNPILFNSFGTISILFYWAALFTNRKQY
jgi:hypothetical protein